MSAPHILPDGRPVETVLLDNGTLSARVLTLGAIVQDLRLAGHPHPLVLGCDDPADYFGPGRYFGAIVGRFANRIGGATVTIDGRMHRLDANFRGRHTLHGGSLGTDLRIWTVTAQARDQVTMALTLPDGDMGFPGTLRATARIALEGTALRFDLAATADAPTPCSLTHHGLFDLDGRGDIRGHRLRIAADHHLPVDADLIPTGEIAPVAGTAYDFRTSRPIGEAGFDLNFCLSDGSRPLRPVAWVQGQDGLTMEVATTACGLQLYDGAHVGDMAGLGGRRYGPHAGLALEAQSWPDAPNRPGFPNAILRPGETWSETTRYDFG